MTLGSITGSDGTTVNLDRLAAAGLDRQVQFAVADARDLSAVPTGPFDAALLMGLKVRSTQWRLYVLSAALAGVAGILAAAYSQSGTPDMGTNYELNAIAAVVIGGTLLTGGAGSLIGTACGVALLAAVQSYINLGTDLPFAAQQVVTGVFVIAVVIVQRIVNNVQRR